jgi:hypothetical protein
MKITMTQSVIEPATFLRLAVPQPTAPLHNPQTQVQSRNMDHASSTMETCMATVRFTDARTQTNISCVLTALNDHPHAKWHVKSAK